MDKSVLSNDGNTETKKIVVHQTDIRPKQFTSIRFPNHPHCLRASISPNTIVCMVDPADEEGAWILSQVLKAGKEEWKCPEDGDGLSITPDKLLDREGCDNLLELLELYNEKNIPIRELKNGSGEIRAFQFQR